MTLGACKRVAGHGVNVALKDQDDAKKTAQKGRRRPGQAQGEVLNASYLCSGKRISRIKRHPQSKNDSKTECVPKWKASSRLHSSVRLQRS